ncbi:3-isopropylmalate dehydratase small subunit [Roseicyclus persicicus]|uniref:3-isopropylmalate dehydratase n=1 Tax=Roseicyclus persicicus TaxID=2650661 RepID=A0A7X6H1T1_9RHOB|nr:3-isopropylmalate dehydratase small subunit [Roseibacterium persicicum]NKX45769.1 3-isopropylmalate dehydratase small subunit [Roseibacterium persicicum]
MSGWARHEGLAVALDRENVDTDQLIPARFMSTPRAEGYGRFLLHDLRFDAGGAPVPSFVLNRAPGASVLVTRRNFGSGSSREAAVYALVDYGIRAVLAPSFGDIFASNAVNNGLLPARIEADAADALIAALGQGTAPATIDLAAGTATVGDTTLPFALDPVWREKLINGWDDIDLTRHHAAAIAAYRARLAADRAWAIPRGEHAR